MGLPMPITDSPSLKSSARRPGLDKADIAVRHQSLDFEMAVDRHQHAPRKAVSRFVDDSPLEGTGFERSVPPDRCGGTRYDLGRRFYGPVGVSSFEPRRFCAVAPEPPCLSQRPCRESLLRSDSDRYSA